MQACRKYEMPPLIIASIILLVIFFARSFVSGYELFLYNSSILITVSLILIIVPLLLSYSQLFIWYLRVKKAAKLDLPVPVMSEARLIDKITDIIASTGYFGGAAGLIAAYILRYFAERQSPQFLLILAAIFGGSHIASVIRKRRREKSGGRESKIFKVGVTAIIISAGLSLVFLFMLYVYYPNLDVHGPIGDRPVVVLQDICPEAAPTERTEICSWTRSSIAVPVQYHYCEFDPDYGGVITEVYQAVSEWTARGLYNNFVKEFTKEFNKTVFEEHIPTLENLGPRTVAWWGAEEGVAVFTPTSRPINLILLRGKTVVRLTSMTPPPHSLDDAVKAVHGLWEGEGS
jgi:hypothetical protein